MIEEVETNTREGKATAIAVGSGILVALVMVLLETDLVETPWNHLISVGSAVLGLLGKCVPAVKAFLA